MGHWGVPTPSIDSSMVNAHSSLASLIEQLGTAAEDRHSFLLQRIENASNDLLEAIRAEHITTRHAINCCRADLIILKNNLWSSLWCSFKRSCGAKWDALKGRLKWR